jgi:hypothetical protein
VKLEAAATDAPAIATLATLRDARSAIEAKYFSRRRCATPSGCAGAGT